MSNETNEQKILSENVKISFDNIVNVYEASSFLLKDLIAELETGFDRLEGMRNAVGTTDLSRDINWPSYWLVRYATLFFRAKTEPDSKRLLSATVIYFDLVPKPVKPYLVMGVGDMFDGGSYEYWWMQRAFFNNDEKFRYYGTDNKILSIGSPHLAWQNEQEEWGFKVTDDSATSYPKAGKLFAVPLLEINSEDVGKLVERASKLWDTNLVWDKAKQ